MRRTEIIRSPFTFVSVCVIIIWVIFVAFKNFLKRYSFLPGILVLATNLIFSFVTRLFLGGRDYYDLVTVLDEKIPFLPGFIYIYCLAFLQWAVCIVALMIVDRETYFRFCIGLTAANILSGAVFLILPSLMVSRPEFSGGGAVTELLGKFIFAADTPPRNIFPSVHCSHSWACLRMLFASKIVPRKFKYLNALFSVAVFLSVLFVKQHCLVDIPAGILIFEAGLLITKLTGIDKKLMTLNL